MKPIVIQHFGCHHCGMSCETTLEQFSEHIAKCPARSAVDPQKCPHYNFFAAIAVARITPDGQPEAPPHTFYAEIHVICDQCGTPFHFVGVDGGLSPRAPRCDPFGLELRAPIKPGPLRFPLAHSVFEMADREAPDTIDGGEV